MRSILFLLALLGLPAAALAGQARATLQVGVTVVAACPPGSGRPCEGTAPVASAPDAAPVGAVTPAGPIAVLRDEAAGTLTIVY
jgi:hypothetical protein